MYIKKASYVLKSLINAAGVFIYILAIAWFLFNVNDRTLFGATPNFFAPVFMLLLFIISASITGLLVLGRPLHLYVNGLKKEAFVLLFATIGWLALFLVGILIVLLVVR